MPSSYRQYLSDGSTTTFSIPFQYGSKADVTVSIDGNPAAFSWVGEFMVKTTLTPTAGSVVEVRRTTPRFQPQVDFTDGSTLSEKDLDASARQLLYVAQEAFDQSDAAITLSPAGYLDARGRRVKNALDPIDPQDLVTKAWVNADLQTAVAAAVSYRDAAGGYASSASGSAATATTKAAETLAQAQAAATSATASSASANAAANSASAAAATISGVPVQFYSRTAAAAAGIAASVAGIRVMGYGSPGDGGAATYKRIAAPNPVKAWHFQSADGAWWGLSETLVSPFMLGAKADGTNDAAAVQASADYVGARPTGGAVRIDGSFTIGTTVTVNKAPIKRTHFIGAGGRLIAAAGFTGRLLYIADPNNTYGGGWGGFVTGVIFDGNGQSCVGLYLEWASTSVIRDNVFQNFAGDAVQTRFSYGPRFEGNIFYNCTRNGIFSDTDCHNTVFTGNRFLACATAASTACIWIDEFSFTIDVVNNSFEVGGNALVMLLGGATITFTGNHIEAMTRTPLYFAAGSDVVKITGNYIAGNTSPPTNPGVLDLGNIRSGLVAMNTFIDLPIAQPAIGTDLEIGYNNYGGTTNRIYSPGRDGTLQNSWAPYGLGFANAGYRKDMEGIVRLQGAIKSGTGGVAAYMLPVGYRPPFNIQVPVLCPGQGIGSVLVQTDGQVIPYPVVANGNVCLDAVQFRAL